MRVYVVISRALMDSREELQNIFEDHAEALEWAELMNKHSEDTYQVEEWPVIKKA